MALKLDPRWPVVWRTPSSLQVGVDPALVRLDEVTTLEERMLAALTVGVTLSGLALICDGRTAERDEFLARLAPALLVESASAAAPVVCVTGSGPLVDTLAAMLASAGVRVRVANDSLDGDDAQPALAIVTGEFVLDPAQHSRWLRRDIPHLPVVMSDTGVTIGPLIEPGSGPCLLCLELHHRDDDSAWPAIASQLLGRRSASASALIASEAAAVAARSALERLAGAESHGYSVRIDAQTGERTERQWFAHAECGCRGIAHLVAVGSTTSRQTRSGSPGAGRFDPAQR